MARFIDRPAPWQRAGYANEAAWQAAQETMAGQSAAAVSMVTAKLAATTTPVAAPAPAILTTPRAAAAQGYAQQPTRGVCRRCGGPVSAGGTSCGEC